MNKSWQDKNNNLADFKAFMKKRNLNMNKSNKNNKTWHKNR